MNTIPILDMKPIARFADGSPVYAFSTSYPTRGVRVLEEGWDDPAVAYALGQSAVHEYTQRDLMGNMGEVLGVAKRDDGYHAVINLYHSNS